MEKLRIAFTDFWPEWNREDFITPILKKHFDVVYDPSSPDVLFHSIFNAMSTTPKYHCKKVLVLFENWRPGQFGSDYSISFDPHSEKNYRLPLWQIYWLLWPELKDKLFNRVRHENFERFCAFTVSNPTNGSRNSAFDRLHEYKYVHSYGKVRTNDLSLIKGTGERYWRDAKREFFEAHPHKFMMAYENSPWPGYCTEKLMDSFLYGSLPIYWGDPKVWEDWNRDAFINAQKIGPDWLQAVKEIDNNPNLFYSIYSQPVFTEEQKTKHLENINNFEDWLIRAVKE